LILRNAGFASIAPALVTAVDINSRFSIDSIASVNPSDNFNITMIALLPLVVVFYMAYKKVPPLPTILFGALLGGVLAVFLQPDGVRQLADSPELSTGMVMAKGIWMALSDGYVSTTGVAEVDDLLTRGGMSSMLVTIWLVMTALAFGAVLEHAGMLERLIAAALKRAKSTGSLVTRRSACAGGGLTAPVLEHAGMTHPGGPGAKVSITPQPEPNASSAPAHPGGPSAWTTALLPSTLIVPWEPQLLPVPSESTAILPGWSVPLGSVTAPTRIPPLPVRVSTTTSCFWSLWRDLTAARDEIWRGINGIVTVSINRG